MFVLTFSSHPLFADNIPNLELFLSFFVKFLYVNGPHLCFVLTSAKRHNNSRKVQTFSPYPRTKAVGSMSESSLGDIPAT